jgi:dynein heavy chain
MKKSLQDLQKAIRGEVVMSEELDKMYVSFLINQVPSIWAKTGYSSLKPLGSWFDDLDLRVKFVRSWIAEGEPLSFWMSAFFFPQGFLTGVLQNYARKRLVPIDTLTFSYEFSNTVEHSNIVVRPDVGVHCHGLYFDACAWDFEEGEITDAKLGNLNPQVPVIHFIPTENYEPNPRNYEIPVYKTSKRAGVLSTTGMSTNFVVPVYMPSRKEESYFIRRGAAMLLQLDQ